MSDFLATKPLDLLLAESKRAAQNAAPAFLYRFDWETPEGGGHMRSPHTIEIQFVFNNSSFPACITFTANWIASRSG